MLAYSRSERRDGFDLSLLRLNELTAGLQELQLMYQSAKEVIALLIRTNDATWPSEVLKLRRMALLASPSISITSSEHNSHSSTHSSANPCSNEQDSSYNKVSCFGLNP